MWKNECKKFKPNIFNKNKCANCYRDREQHSDEALEVNKATRIVSKCGYLFVAPNWDFTNPVSGEFGGDKCLVWVEKGRLEYIWELGFIFYKVLKKL